MRRLVSVYLHNVDIAVVEMLIKQYGFPKTYKQDGETIVMEW